MKVNSPHIEALEDRRMLAWGPFPVLIGQDQAVAQQAAITGSGVNIAVIDSGVDLSHANLSGKFWTNPGEIAGDGIDNDSDGYVDNTRGWDFYNNDNTPEDQNGHGTAISGILVASQFTYGGKTYQGIAPGAKIIPLKISDPTGAYNLAFAQRVEKALQWVEANATRYNIGVISMSIRTPLADYNATYADEITRLIAKGVFIAAAGGQEDPNKDAEYPAASAGVFGVSVINASDKFPTDYVNRGPNIDLLAPGDEVPILLRGGSYGSSAEATSYSTPFAAGAAALVRQVNKNFSITQITAILQDSGVNVKDTSTGYTYSGRTYKRLSVIDAIELAKTRSSTASTNNPGQNGTFNSLKYDNAGNLHFVWYDSSTKTLKYAKRTGENWSAATTIDGGTDVGSFVSLAVNGTTPGVAYYDANNADLKYAQLSGSTWNVATVDSKSTTGYYPSLGFDGSGNPFIAYYQKTAGDLRVATRSGSTWTIATIDSTNDVGRYPSVARTSSGVWGVAYENTSTGLFKYAQRSTSGKWTYFSVDDTNLGGGFISLAFDASSRPGFSYYDAYAADLKYAHYNGSSWAKQVVASKNSVGLYTNLFYESNKPGIYYFSKTANSLLTARNTTGSTWVFETIANGGGRHNVLARDGDGFETYSWLDDGDGDLNITDA